MPISRETACFQAFCEPSEITFRVVSPIVIAQIVMVYHDNCHEGNFGREMRVESQEPTGGRTGAYQPEWFLAASLGPRTTLTGQNFRNESHRLLA